MALIVVARAESWAILWRGAILATLATLDDRVCRLDPAGGVRRYQSHRPNVSLGLGTRDDSRRAVPGRRLVSLRSINPGRVCSFKAVAVDQAAPRSRRADSFDLLARVLCRLGHLRTDPEIGPGLDL